MVMKWCDGDGRRRRRREEGRERKREGGRERKRGKKAEEIVKWTTGVSLGEARARVSAGRREGVPVRDSSFLSFKQVQLVKNKYNK